MKLANTIFAFTWGQKQFTWIVMPRGFTESPYFSQILKADLGDKRIPWGSTLLPYVDNLLLCSSSHVFSQEDNIHLLKVLAFKRHKFAKKKKLQFARTRV